MKLPKLLSCVLLLLFVLFGLEMNAQEKEKPEFKRYLGIGLSTPVIQIHELQDEVVPGNRLLLGYDPIEYLRLEVHGAMYKNDHMDIFTDYASGKGYALKMKEDSKLWGVGVFGVYPKEHWKYVAGLRYSRDKYEIDEIVISDQNPRVITDHGKVNIITGVIGAEYYFNKWFSLGGELNIMRMKNTVYSAVDIEPLTTIQKGVFELGIAFTVYPF